MPKLSFAARAALALLVMPFLLGGLELVWFVYRRLVESGLVQSGVWLWVSFFALFLAGVVLSALLAYGAIIFCLAWFAPSSPWLVQYEIANPSFSLRMMAPLLRIVRRFALWLVPGPQKSG